MILNSDSTVVISALLIKMAELEPLLINLDNLMCQQTLERLLELHKHLKIITPATGKSKLKVVGMIRAHNEEKLEGEIETGVMPEEYLQYLNI